MTAPSFWSRVRHARLFQVVIVYLGASWLVLQITNVLRDTLALPQWVSPVALLLLLIGLVIILGTAWVQSHPATAQKAAADEVPGRWEVDVAEIKRSLVKGELPHPTWARAILGGVFAFSLLFGLAGLYVVIKDRGQTFAPEEAVAAAAPAIAVLPFTVNTADLAVWREGMMDLLSTNLDGIGGLRAIDSRTLMARWRDQVDGEATPDVPTMLEVARGTGARFALIGGAVALAGNVRLTADVYEVATGAELGSARVEGPPDSVMTMVDRLSVDVLRSVLAQAGGELPLVPGLATITTTSLPALKAYLEGEALYRRSRFDRAIPLYERALAADSNFALALGRLSDMYGWTERAGSERARRYVELAARHADRLPGREALILRGKLELERGTLDGIGPLRQAVQMYPDDPEAWYQLGDTYWHFGPQALIAQEEADQAFTRAIELDPSFAPYYIHLVEDALHSGDRAHAEQLVETYDRLAPGDDFHQANHLLFALIYGDSLAQRDARVALDTVQPASLRRGVVRRILSRADLLPYRETTERRIRASPERGFADAWRLVEALKYRGKVRAALEVLSSDPILLPAHRAESFYALYRMGVILPAAELERALTVADADTAINAALMGALVSGAYAADRRRWAEHQRAVAIARAQAERAHAAADSVTERVALGVAGALEAYGSWRRGRPDEALPTLQRAQQEAVGHAARTVLNEHLRWWLAELNAELGRPQEAIRYLDTLEDDPFFRYRLGALYEELGETEKARAHYAYALTAWAEADPDFAPARQARAALTRLGSDRP